ncbi:hypothetical protein L2E82_37414 [Cichorium intybus]|uniref:Uncharacterized protein n=1 Tax=Cichorium intybus TaxID=13427 RepID=A0ACB9AF67_CICIN|nr:hypothetical protein L2E82_37414 [Cichorium intybus]
MGVRFCWSFLCAIYVWFILVGMLLSSFMISGFMMKHVVKQPVDVEEMLNFDYTMASPVAVVPLSSFTGLGNKLQLTVSLTMPESEYNRKVGVFQVRVDFLSATGKITSSASYPCILRFKSQPIRIAETVLKSVPLMTGFQAEVQKLNIKFDEFSEQKEPSASIRVVLEQRAEFKHAGGIPEVYSGSLHLWSKLPKIKQILWTWKITVFVWISIMSFLTQLVVALTFYRATLTKAMKQKKIS